MQEKDVLGYSQAVDLLKEVKRSNDRINSSIGVESACLVVSCLAAQSIPIELALARV
jgi:hypothetical protein